MFTDIKYGRGSIQVHTPADRSTVVAPASAPAALDARHLLHNAIRRPVSGQRLRDRVSAGATVAISVCDITRPQPRREMIQAILDELEGVVRTDDVTVLLATGTHRRHTADEILEMVGPELTRSLRIVDHDSRDDSTLTWCGVHGNAVPVWLDSQWVEADIRITTGFVEPHFFAGFSGGPKMVAPGLAGLETVLTLHSAKRIADERATWGVCIGNPVHDDVRAIATATGVDFSLDVVLNADQHIVAAFAGEVLAAHAAARAAVRGSAMRQVNQLFDVVVTSNAGHPLDQNLYQAVKGMSAASTIVRPGGLILCAAACVDGFPSHGSFVEELTAARDPRDMARRILERDHTRPDQWQAQVLARVLLKAKVAVFTDGLSAEQLRVAHLAKVDDVSAAVRRELEATDGQVCLMPEGPMTIPYLRSG